MNFNRIFAMPNHETFSIKPIEEFVKKYLSNSNISVDMFARNKEWFTYSNDLNPNTKAKEHLQAEEFLNNLWWNNIRVDLGIFDPPYSPRQITECYKSIGLEVSKEDTQSGRLYKNVRDKLDKIIIKNGIILSFGWNSVGMGKNRGYEILEVMLVTHGGAHNDTICMAERKL